MAGVGQIRLFTVLGVLLAILAALNPIGAESGGSATADSREARLLGDSGSRMSNGLFKIVLSDGKVLFTHGPDPKPDHEYSFGSSSPQRPPVCATDYYQHALYSHLSAAPNRYLEVKEEIKDAIKRMNAVLFEEAAESGGVEADFKVKCDESGEVDVGYFPSYGTEFDLVVESARAAGYDTPTANYSIFFDWNHPAFCGVGSLWEDESPGIDNLNNQGGAYAVNYEGCWRNRTAMHENGHNMGATQYGAPDSTGYGHHCNDQYDVMCYVPDGGDRNQLGDSYDCVDKMHYDCQHDTYFDAEPEEGEYLWDHWNVGSRVNRFIHFGGPASPPPPKPAESLQAPSFLPECMNARCRFRNSTTSPEITHFTWDFGDGSPVINSYSPLHTYASNGAFDVTLTAYAENGDTSSRVRTAHVFTEDPDPQAPTLTRYGWFYSESQESGTWLYFKVQVPSKGEFRASVYSGCSQTLDCFWASETRQVSCLLDLCERHELYLKRGARPTSTSYDCWADGSSRGAQFCTMPPDQGGLWYIGVLTSTDNSSFDLYTSYD